jgi:hypothetical protein
MVIFHSYVKLPEGKCKWWRAPWTQWFNTSCSYMIIYVHIVFALSVIWWQHIYDNNMITIFQSSPNWMLANQHLWPGPEGAHEALCSRWSCANCRAQLGTCCNGKMMCCCMLFHLLYISLYVTCLSETAVCPENLWFLIISDCIPIIYII